MTTLIPLLVLLAVIIIGLLLWSKTNAIAVAMNQRLDIESRVAASIQKVENVLTGSVSKGSAAENLVEAALMTLPSEWLVRNYTVGNKIVEFGVRLPDNLVLPIDSKLAVTDLLDQFITSQDDEQRRKLKGLIQSRTANRALEVRKYLNPNITTSFGLAVVPDSLFTICYEITPDLSQQNVMLVSYSMLIPYILLIFHMTLKSAHSIDLQRLDGFVKAANQIVIDLQSLLQGKFSRATTMLNNFRNDLEAQLSRLSATLVSLTVLEMAANGEAGPQSETGSASST